MLMVNRDKNDHEISTTKKENIMSKIMTFIKKHSVLLTTP